MSNASDDRAVKADTVLAPRGPALSMRVLFGWWRLPIGIRWAAVLAEMMLLWWTSSRPMSLFGTGIASSMLHNSMHVVAYGAMAALCAMAAASPGVLRTGGAALAVLVAAGYGLIDELHQGHVPGRVCSVADWGSDLSGACLGVAVLGHLIRPRRVGLLVVAVLAVAATVCVWLATYTEM